MDITQEKAIRLRKLGDPENVKLLYEIGSRAAERQITLAKIEGW